MLGATRRTTATMRSRRERGMRIVGPREHKREQEKSRSRALIGWRDFDHWGKAEMMEHEMVQQQVMR
jgi:hypothetical protein